MRRFSVFSKRDNELLSKLIININLLLSDPDVDVQKKAISVMAQLYPVALMVSFFFAFFVSFFDARNEGFSLFIVDRENQNGFERYGADVGLHRAAESQNHSYDGCG